MPAGIILNASRSLAAHETICNGTNQLYISYQRHHLKMYDVLPLEAIATIRIFKVPIYRFFSKWVFSDMNLITFTVST